MIQLFLYSILHTFNPFIHLKRNSRSISIMYGSNQRLMSVALLAIEVVFIGSFGLRQGATAFTKAMLVETIQAGAMSLSNRFLRNYMSPELAFLISIGAGIVVRNQFAKMAGLSGIEDIDLMQRQIMKSTGMGSIDEIDDFLKRSGMSLGDLNEALKTQSIDDIVKLMDETSEFGSMKYHDAVEYSRYLDEVENGVHLPPDVDIDDYKRMLIAEGRLDELNALSKIDGDELMEFRLEQQRMLNKLDPENRVKAGEVILDTNHRKGNFGEMVMDRHYDNLGYERISLDEVIGLDDTIKRGIDGVYYKEGGQPPYIIAEAKYGTSQLNTLTDGTRQMSYDWIEGRCLEEAVGEEMANKISEAVYKSELVRVNPDGSTIIKKIDVNGKVIK